MSDIKNITILTGAGISAESGIPVFRSETGLWEEHRVEDVAMYDGFVKNPILVHDFYNTMRAKLANVKPNVAHLALTTLQEKWQFGTVNIITQNIDDLHERAGSKNVIHMHGELKSLLCEHCGGRFKWEEDSSIASECPRCHHQKMRPDIVWFGEMPYQMNTIYDILQHTSLFLSIGTSGVVYPAAGFVRLTKECNAYNIEFNLEQSLGARDFDRGIYGKATQTLPKFVDNLLQYGDLQFLNSESVR